MNIEDTLAFIRELAHKARRPALMCSFGKDSMVLASLIRTAIKQPAMRNGFPVDIIYHRDPWFTHKHEFAEDTARAWNMVVYDYPPVAAGVKVKDDMLELVVRYNFGSEGMDVPKNTCLPSEYPRRDYICGLNDWLLRPKTMMFPYPWDLVFSGHKSSDVDPFEGAVPLNTDVAELGGVLLAFPLRHWSDSDIWDYIEEHHIPMQATRYKGREELPDKWYNNDYIHACTACIDPRVKGDKVYCPKLKSQVPNVGHRVLQLHADPGYVTRELNANFDERLKQRIRSLEVNQNGLSNKYH
jgi:3'-phosphoadenosine 5'-phosphosulfate sulfotransferase (PAPS reductase)/FAD synthetase